MAYAFLPPIIELAEKLLRMPSEPPHFLQAQEDLEALQRMVRRIQAVLNDAEKMQIHNESVRLCLRELTDVASDADRVLDVYEYQLLRAKVEAGIQVDEAAHLPFQQKHRKGIFEMILRRWFQKTADRPRCHTVEVNKSAIASISSDVRFWGKIADRVGKIRGLFEEISKQLDALDLREGDEQGQFQNTIDPPPSSHIVDAPTIYSRVDDLEKVINRLLYSYKFKKSNVSVLPIVGMGGVGKMNLIQHVYNDNFQIMKG